MNNPKTAINHLVKVVPVFLLAAVAIYLLVRPALLSPAPTPEQWLETADHIRNEFQEGDVIRLEPAWMTAGRVFFGDLDDKPRKPFRILDLHDPVDKAWLYGFQRLWLVTTVESQGTEDTIIPPQAELLESTTLTATTVSLYQLPGMGILWQMTKALPASLVERELAERTVTCKWRGDTHRCGIKPHYDVKIQLRRVAGGPRQCVLVQPGPGPSLTTLSFPDLTGPGTLLIRLGNTVESAASAKHGDTVIATVRLDDQDLVTWQVDKRDYHLEELRHEIVDAGVHTLAIRMEATDDKHREICFDGYLVKPGFVD